MKQSIRQQKIVELVKARGYIGTEELVITFEVTPQTIRRDLNELAERNLILRHHGGAAAPSTVENSDYHERKHFFTAEKNRIAMEVVKLIPHGASLFIDIGTTAEAVAHHLLSHEKLRIVTNNLNAAHILMQNSGFDITVASGTLRPDGGIIGESTMAFLNQFRLDFGILGISAIDNDGIMLDYDYHEVQLKRTILENSRATILVTDHSKFTRRAMVKLGSIARAEYVITDSPPNEAIQTLLESQNVKLVVC